MKGRNQSAEIHFIGGEPTMLGLSFFEYVVPEFRKAMESSGINYSLILVSNLLSKEIVPIAKLFDKVTTSYEPETRFPKKKLQAWFEDSVDLLHKNGIDTGATVAVTKQVIQYGGARIIEYLESLGIHQIHFGFFIPEGDGLVNISETFPEFHKTSQFMIDISDYYLPRRGGELIINPIESMISSLHTLKPMDDIICPIISGSIDINWDGNCSSCLEAGGALNPQYSGNVFDKDIIEITSDDNFMREYTAAIRPKKPCMSCEYQPICKGACSVLFKYYNKDSRDCHGFKLWIDYLVKKIESGEAPYSHSYHVSGKGC